MGLIKRLLGAGLMIAVTACGSSSSSDKGGSGNSGRQVLSPQTTSVSGVIGKAYTVVNRDYKPQGDGSIKRLNVEVELTDTARLPEGFGSANVGTADDMGEAEYNMIADFKIELLDEDGDIIETKDCISGADRLLHLTENGDRATITFYVPGRAANIRYFRIVSDYYPNKIEGATNTSAINETADSSDAEFEKAMDHAVRAVETTGKMIKSTSETLRGIIDLAK